MRGITLLSLLLFVLGAALLYHGLRLEGGQVYLFLVFPVFVLSGPISLLGTLLIFFSLFLGFLSLMTPLPGRLLGPEALNIPFTGEVRQSAEPPAMGTREKRWGGFLLLGPVPIIFGSDVKVTTAMLILAVVLTATLLLLFLW